MILNTGARTDTVNYFSEWLIKRFRKGFVCLRNPHFRDNIIKYELNPKNVDVVLFCSKNYLPILPYLHEINDNFRTYYYYTITAYSRDIEPNVPDIDTSIKTLIELAKIVKKEKVAWRYDPVFINNKYTIDEHLKTFNYIAKAVSKYIDRCIFSFVEMYKKLKINFPELIAPSLSDKNILARGLSSIANHYGIKIQTCGSDDDYTAYGINSSGCATLDILGKANNCQFGSIKHRGFRNGCHCVESHDIGAYDTCLNGCKYCYANTSVEKVRKNYKLHNPDSPLLIGCIQPTDKVILGSGKSFIKSVDKQLSMFE